MFESINSWTKWWVDGLTDVAVPHVDRLMGERLVRLKPDGAGGYAIFATAPATPSFKLDVKLPLKFARRTAVVTPPVDPAPSPVDLKSVGHMRLGEGGIAAFEPETAEAVLAGSRVEIEIPASWTMRRRLDPLATQSLPYVDAFARHHIERVTPWRVNDTYFGVATSPLPDDTSRIGVEVSVVPRHLVDTLVNAVKRTSPRKLVLVTDAAHPVTIPVDAADGGRRKQIERGVRAVVVGLAAATVLVLVGASWRMSALEHEIAELERATAARKAVLNEAAELARPKGDVATALRMARIEAPLAVVLLEAVSTALPDQAHATEFRVEKGGVRVVGIARDVSELIPALEASPYLKSVASFAPTTRLQNGGGDRFYLDMRAERPRAAEAR